MLRFSDDKLKEVERLVSFYPEGKQKSAVLPVLHLAQQEFGGWLDVPAVVRIDPLLMNEGPVFQTEAEGGCMLATENPNYFRKELPKYISQFFVIELMSGDPQRSNMNFKRIIEENFPIEKLKAMIDK